MPEHEILWRKASVWILKVEPANQVWSVRNKQVSRYLTNNLKNYSFTDTGKTLEGQVSSEGLVLRGSFRVKSWDAHLPSV